MELVRWNPRRNLFNWPLGINRMFEDFFPPTILNEEGVSMGSWNPVVDIYENDENIIIKAELPGVDKKDISVNVKDRILTLRGERSADNEVKEDNYYHRERSYGKFERSFTLPADVNPDKVKADFKDGILKLDIPKPEARKPKKITVH